MDDIRTYGGVEILKASAGSGKTYTLALEYIRLLLLERGREHAHRHILAVTFTNKATGEMKDRIIAQLDLLARDPLASSYTAILMKECRFASVDELQAAAGEALRDILGDYGAFAVSTIDRFFQQTLRAFAREAGQFNEYRIELDRDELVAEGVDRLLDSLSTGEGSGELLEWLSASSISHLESGDGYHLEGSLASFARGCMKDSFRQKEKDAGIDRSKAFSEENLRRIMEICSAVCSSFDREFKAAANHAKAVIDGYVGINSKLSNQIAKFAALRPGEKIELPDTKYWADSIEDGSKAFTVAARKACSASDFDRVRSALRGIADVYERGYRLRNTAEILRSQVDLFRVADALDSSFKDLLKEKNVLSIDDTNTILHDIIGGTDAPFIYEKMGVRYSHFLLDEFQDTSTVQWDNFRPLLAESIGQGCYNLVVGDVKQSIYRWRDADWRILDTDVEASLQRALVRPLAVNWRSAENIVSFNNAFFARLARSMDESLAVESGLPSDGRIEAIYADVEQETGGKVKVPGCVDVTFCDDVAELMLAAVEEAHDERGFAYKDIAVIVRTNLKGEEMASKLVAAGIPVISNDSLSISSSRVVRRLVSRLYLLDDPSDAIHTFYAGECDLGAVALCQSLLETAQALLSQMDEEEVNGDTLYVLAFLDLMRDFVSRNGNSLHAFLRYWRDEGIGHKVSSPEGTDAVTVITIHKVKGLDYPFVVLPLQQRSDFVSSKATSWECPDFADTPLAEVENALYEVQVSSSLRNTLFNENYRREVQRLYVDGINIWYVAMTRASEAMHIIGPKPSGDALGYDGTSDLWPKCGNIATPLYCWCVSGGLEQVEDCPEEIAEDGKSFYKHFRYGVPAQKEADEDAPEAKAEGMPLTYGSGTFAQRGRLKVNGDAAEFFAEGGGGISPRVRGIVLHGILERVIAPDDLHASVRKAVSDGLLSSSDADRTEEMLARAIDAVIDRGWFPADASALLNERDIVGEGHYYRDGKRPDRVVFASDGGIDVIDYKFGAPRASYLDQVRLYASLFRDLGYTRVTPYIWYVETGTIVDAS